MSNYPTLIIAREEYDKLIRRAEALKYAYKISAAIGSLLKIQPFDACDPNKKELCVILLDAVKVAAKTQISAIEEDV